MTTRPQSNATAIVLRFCAAVVVLGAERKSRAFSTSAQPASVSVAPAEPVSAPVEQPAQPEAPAVEQPAQAAHVSAAPVEAQPVETDNTAADSAADDATQLYHFLHNS